MAASRSKPEARTARSPESFESMRERDHAAEILQSYEMLSWYAIRRCEVCVLLRSIDHSSICLTISQTITQTRMHFQCIVAGFTEEDTKKRRVWIEDFTPHSPKPGQESRSSHKGKDRASLGGEKESAAKSASGGSGSRDRNKSKQNQKSAAIDDDMV